MSGLSSICQPRLSSSCRGSWSRASTLHPARSTRAIARQPLACARVQQCTVYQLPTVFAHSSLRPRPVPRQVLTGSSVSGQGSTAASSTLDSSVIQQLFGKDWQSLKPTITPDPAELSARQQAVAALQRCLKSGTAQLVGSAAAGLALPGCDADIVVLLPGLTAANHAAELEAVAAAVKSAAGQQEGFTSVVQGVFSVECSRAGINIDIVVGTDDTAAPTDYLAKGMTEYHRKCLSASTAVATAAVLSCQPPLCKAAVRLVKCWARQLHGKDWNDKLGNRPKSFLLVLLTLKAYQQHITAAAAVNSAAAAAAVPGSSHDEAAALGCILQNFLRLAAQLSSSSVFSWELQYSSDTVQQVLARPDLAAVLRPKGCEGHPIILDPACPTNNVAAAVADLSRLQQLAAADLAKVGGSRIALLEQQLQEQKQLVQQQAKRFAALLLHQRMLSFQQSNASVPRHAAWTWPEFSMPVSAWLPGTPEQVLSTKWTDIDGAQLWISIVSKPYSSTAYGDDKLAGFALRLAAGGSTEMASIVEMRLAVPIAVLKGTTITLESPGSSSGSSTSTIQLQNDVQGVMIGSSGVLVALDFAQLRELGLLSCFSNIDKTIGFENHLESKKHWTIKVVLKFRPAVPVC